MSSSSSARVSGGVRTVPAPGSSVDETSRGWLAERYLYRSDGLIPMGHEHPANGLVWAAGPHPSRAASNRAQVLLLGFAAGTPCSSAAIPTFQSLVAHTSLPDRSR